MVLYFIIREMMNKNNVPYYIAGTLATFTLLASGVFAAAPYIGFLAPVAALSVGLPFIIGGVIISAVVIAFSAVVIQKNGAIRRQGALLDEEAKKNAELTLELQEKEAEISGMQKQLANQAKEIEGKDTQLTDEKSKVEAKEKEITVKDAQLVKQAEEIEGKDKIISERDTKIEKDKLKVAIADGTVQLAKGTVNSAVWFAKEAVNGVLYSGKYAYDNYVPSTESTKGTLSGIGNKLKNIYDTMPSTESARNWVPSLKTAGWIAGGTGLLVGTTYIIANGGLSIAGNSFNVAGNSTNGTESDASISNLSSVYYRPTDQQIKQSQIHEINKKLADTDKWYEDNYGTPKEDSLSNKGIFSSICNKVSSVWSSLGNLISGSNESAHNCSEPQWYKDLHKSEDLEEIIDGGVLDNLFFPRMDNSINTSKQQGTLIDSVDLEKLIQEPHPSAYPNGSSRIL